MRTGRREDLTGVVQLGLPLRARRLDAVLADDGAHTSLAQVEEGCDLLDRYTASSSHAGKSGSRCA